MGYPSKIATFLKTRNVPTLNAKDIRDFIINWIENQEANSKIIVFSQDVVPDTIFDETTSNTLLREYLDAEGNILWMGDIPLFYIGRANEKELVNAWRYGAPVYMLGILPLFVSTLKSVKLHLFSQKLCQKKQLCLCHFYYEIQRFVF